VAVVATLSKGYDLDYIWTQVDRGPAKDAASYYLQASESGGARAVAAVAAVYVNSESKCFSAVICPNSAASAVQTAQAGRMAVCARCAK
jgi:hypothetical protein